MEKFSESRQMEICKDKEYCFFGDAPTLASLGRDYDEEAPAAWVVPQLTGLGVFANVRHEMDRDLIEECAKAIVAEYSYLKLTEIMFFFYLFKVGRFGKFFGSVSPLDITCALRKFTSEVRNEYIWHHENKIYFQKREEDAAKACDYNQAQELISFHKKIGDYEQWLQLLEEEYRK